MNNTLEQKIAETIKPVIEEIGFSLVFVEYSGGTLQIMAEDKKTGNLGIEDCARISREISPLLEVEDFFGDKPYRLEVSSPGIDRPLVNQEDFKKYAGFRAKIMMKTPINGQKRFKGTLGNDIKDGLVTLHTDNEDVTLQISDIAKARLLLDDKLMDFSKNRLSG